VTVNGRYPDAEVIVTFADGWSYSKTRMAKFQADGGLSSVPPLPKPPKDMDVVVPQKEDVQLIMSEFEVSKPIAEKALVQAQGDLKKALEILIGVPQKEQTKEDVEDGPSEVP